MSNPNSIVSKKEEGKIAAIPSPPASPTSRPVNIRGQWTHNPIVLAALSCTNMGSCEEVKGIYKECQESKSDSMLCEAAEKYYKMCHMNGNTDTVLDYSPYQE